jgi:hypothetical protein
LELETLRRAQAALKRGDGAAALHELDAHELPEGALLAELQAARILALCVVGRIGDARRAAEEFARQHPGSPQQAAIASSCANVKRNGAP